VKSADQAYYRLILLVGESGSGKTEALRTLAEEMKVEIINLNLALSELLLGYTPKQRSLQLPVLMDQLIEAQPSPVLLDNIELLFDHGLQIDPLRLLQGIARNHTIIATWNGYVSNGRLIYATPDHPEYQTYNTQDINIVLSTDSKAEIIE